MKKFDEFLNERITIKKASEFKDAVKKIVEEDFGGIEDTTFPHRISWNLETNVGNLKIILHDNVGSDIYTIFMKFDKPEAAKHLVKCNPFSGKWNIHQRYFDSAIEDFKSRLEFVTGDIKD